MFLYIHCNIFVGECYRARAIPKIWTAPSALGIGVIPAESWQRTEGRPDSASFGRCAAFSSPLSSCSCSQVCVAYAAVVMPVIVGR